MKKPSITNGVNRGRRRLVAAGSVAVASAALGLRAPAVIGQTKRFSGVTLNVSCWSAKYPRLLEAYVGEFGELTGAKVNYDTPGLQVYNQRADLELSTKGAGYDVLNITFIFSNRWIGNGWFTPLDPYLNDRNKTQADFDFADFLPGAVSPMKDRKGVVYGVPWVTDSGMSVATRYDILQASGLGMPDTFEELEKTLAVIHKKDGVAGFLTDNHWGFWYPPFLQGYGGDVFRGAPDDLMPTLDTPEAIHSADLLARIVRNYSLPGAGGMSYGQTQELLRAGKANYAFVTHVGGMSHAEPEAKVAKTLHFSLYPRGPKGRFPGIASHGWGIPAGSKNKDAAWEFIKWATSKTLITRMVREKHLGSVTRRSIYDAPEYRKLINVNGQDTGQIVLDTIKLGEQGHMKYRTPPVYPQVNVQLNQAIGRIISGQMSAKESMTQAQTSLIADFRRAGMKI
ncbi:MAG: extracellular solute-binding protein [Burkholderiales bacterium]|nr:extracellular solute-binding protein [Burkholderiales bacterium]